MKTLLIGLSLFIGQMNTHQGRPVVHLPLHRDIIPADYGGKLLELLNAPLAISLPFAIPTIDAEGFAWSVDIKNLGPHRITITGKQNFSLQVNVGQTMHIYANGTLYSALPLQSSSTPQH